jgi:hypothetical protein
MGGECSTYWERSEVHTQCGMENMQEWDSLEDLGTGGTEYSFLMFT